MTESVKWLLMQFAPFKLHLQSSALRLSGVQMGLFSGILFSINFPPCRQAGIMPSQTAKLLYKIYL